MIDLHDSIGGKLGAIALIAGRLKLDELPEKLIFSKLDKIRRLVEESRQILPRIVWSTQSARQSLEEELKTMLDELCMGVVWNLDTKNFMSKPRLPEAIEDTLYFIARESVQNAMKHSGASEICVRLAEGNRGPFVEVTDNGSFKGDPGKDAGIGLTGMHDRCRRVKAELEISPSESGTTVTCVIPRASFV